MTKLPCKDCYWRMTNIRGNVAEKNKGKSRPALCNHPTVTPNASDKQQILTTAYNKYCKGKGFRDKKDKY